MYLSCTNKENNTNSLIFPYFSYCNLIWSTANAKRLDKLFILQNKAVRIISKTDFLANTDPIISKTDFLAHTDPIISKADFLAHTDPIFNKFGLLKITDVGKLQISIYIFKFFKHDLPESFKEYFSLNPDSRYYFTRQSSGLHIHFAKTDYAGKEHRNTRFACMEQSTFRYYKVNIVGNI